MITFVLVHGGFIDGRVWDDTAAALRADGHRVLTPDMPSSGPDPEALGDLAADEATLRAVLDDAAPGARGDDRTAELVLVGHSAGGVVLGEVADHAAITRTVYLTAFRPESGTSLTHVVGGRLLPWQRMHPGGHAIEPVDDAELTRHCLAPDVGPEPWRRCHALLVPTSAVHAATPARPRPRSHPATYVVCEHDEVIPPPAQERMAAGLDATLRIASAHMPHVAAPRALARVLERAVTGAPSPA